MGGRRLCQWRCGTTWTASTEIREDGYSRGEDEGRETEDMLENGDSNLWENISLWAYMHFVKDGRGRLKAPQEPRLWSAEGKGERDKYVPQEDRDGDTRRRARGEGRGELGGIGRGGLIRNLVMMGGNIRREWGKGDA